MPEGVYPHFSLNYFLFAAFLDLHNVGSRGERTVENVFNFFTVLFIAWSCNLKL